MEPKLKEIMADVFGVAESELDDDTTMKAVARWDSLKHMELIAAIEEQFEVVLTADEIIAMTSVRAIYKILNEKGKYS